MNEDFDLDFDLDFYLETYPDIVENGLTTYTKAYNHYINYGKKEGRICNNSNMKNNYEILKDNEILKIKNYNFEEKFHIIIRTHLREKFFHNAISSVLNQNYSNYTIHIIYDHNDSYRYIKQYAENEKIKIHAVKKSSDNECFFDIYCEEIKETICDGWIMFLDDDNYYVDENCFKIINNSIFDEKIIIWYFLRPDKLIIPDLDDLKYGTIDNCSYLFHYSIKNYSSFSDYYGSDFNFINKLIKHFKSKLIDYTLVATQYFDKISNSQMYNLNNSFKLSYTDLNRIDFEDYKEHYKDLNDLSLNECKNHYDKHGKFESRIIKFNDFNYEKFKHTINHYNTNHISNLKFICITTLYNETNESRLNEYIISLEHHKKNQFIEKIIVFYDNSNGKNDVLFDYFSTNSKIEIIECFDRPYFVDIFKYANNNFSNKKIILCNGDIIFDNSLHKFDSINLENKIYAITRWDFVDEVTPKPRIKNDKIMHSSKDSWIFESSLVLNDVNSEMNNIKMGTWNCDGAINTFLKDYVVYECLNIKTYHVHFCNGRKYKDNIIEY